jgi:hypothetical protein
MRRQYSTSLKWRLKDRLAGYTAIQGQVRSLTSSHVRVPRLQELHRLCMFTYQVCAAGNLPSLGWKAFIRYLFLMALILFLLYDRRMRTR